MGQSRPPLGQERQGVPGTVINHSVALGLQDLSCTYLNYSCRYRNHPRHAGEDVYLPATFDSIHGEDVEDLDILEELEDDDQAEVRSSTFSTARLN